MVTERAIAGLTASTHAPAASAVLSFDCIVNPSVKNRRSRHPASLSQNSLVNYA